MNDYGWLGPACRGLGWDGNRDTVPTSLLLWPRCISERHWLGGKPFPASAESRGSNSVGNGTSISTCRHLVLWACLRHTYALEPEQHREKGLLWCLPPHLMFMSQVEPTATTTALLFITFAGTHTKKSLMTGGWQSGLGWSLRITVRAGG